MKQVKVSKAELKMKLAANREIHIKEFEETLQGYRDQVQAVMAEQMSKAEDGLDVDFRAISVLQAIPTSHEKDYDRAIAMLSMSVDDHLTLEKQDFDQLVMDEWSWKSSFDLLASTYNGKKAL